MTRAISQQLSGYDRTTVVLYPGSGNTELVDKNLRGTVNSLVSFYSFTFDDLHPFFEVVEPLLDLWRTE